MKHHLKLITSQKRMFRLWNEGRNFCAIDTETSGIKSLTDSIIEIAAVKFNKETVSDNFSSLINPFKKLDPFITSLTGITDEDLNDAPPPEEVLNSFLEFTEGTILVAHNAQFDLRFINAGLENINLPPLKNECIDTLRLSRLLLPQNKTWKQGELARQFNIDTGSEHRAFDDAKTCASLFTVLIKKALQKNAGPENLNLEFVFK